MGRSRSHRKRGGDFLKNEVFSKPSVDWQKSSQEFSRRNETIRDFQKQLDRDVRITNDDLKKEFQI